MKKEGLGPVEIAQKQRHLYLLTQVKNGRPLTRAELAELDGYEQMAGRKSEGTQKKKISRLRGPGGKFIKKTQISNSKSPSGEFATLGAELKQLAALDKQFDEHFKLEEYPRVKAALEKAIAERAEEIIRQQFEKKGRRDYRRITLQQLIEITNKGRRTIYFWIKKGFPREEDGSFWLPNVFEWLEKYTESKVLERQPEDKKLTPYQFERAKQLRRINEEEEHRLLDRGEVLSGMLARHQQLISSLTHKAEELALEAHGQPQAKIAEMLNNFFDEVLRQQCNLPEQLHLPPETAEKFRELLNSLK